MMQKSGIKTQTASPDNGSEDRLPLFDFAAAVAAYAHIHQGYDEDRALKLFGFVMDHFEGATDRSSPDVITCFERIEAV